MGWLFPEVFGNEVPSPLLHSLPLQYSLTQLILPTVHTDNQHQQIKLALDEVAMKVKEVAFKHDIYADIYIHILGLMAKCNMNPIQCTKTKALCVHWAKMDR